MIDLGRIDIDKQLPEALLPLIRKNQLANMLLEAWQLIADDKNWCKGSDARDKNGNPIEASSPKAAKFCARGALQAIPCKDRLKWNAVAHLLCTAVDVYSEYTTTVNDVHGHNAVRMMYRIAILKALKKGKQDGSIT